MIDIGLLNARDNNMTAYRREVAKLRDFYHGDQLAHLATATSEDGQGRPVNWTGLIARLFKHPEDVAVMATVLNITARSVDLLAAAYDPGPERKLDGVTDDQSAAYAAVAREAQWDDAMAYADAMAELTGGVLIRPAMRNSAWALDVITPDRVWVLPDPDVPNRMSGFVYVTKENGDVPNGKRRLVAWTATHYWSRPARYNECYGNNPLRIFHEQPTGENPYGVLPAVWVQNYFYPDGPYPPIDDTFLSIQEKVNVIITCMMDLAKKQGFATLVLKKENPGSDENISVGTGKPLLLNSAYREEAGYIQPDAPFDNLVTLTREVITMASAMKNINPAVFFPSGDNMSGVALQLLRYDLDQYRVSRTRKWASVEASLFDILRIIGNTEGRAARLPLMLPPSATLILDYAERTYPTDPQTEVNFLLKQVQEGLEPIDKLVRFLNPGLTTEEQVAEHLRRARERNTEFPLLGGGGAVAADADELADDILEGLT